MHKIGITGGMGSGKSTVCAIFASMGVPVYNADYEAKQLYTTDLTLKQTIIAHFGEEVYPNGQFHAATLAAKVFGNEAALQQLNEWVHPRVKQHAIDWMQRQTAPYCIKEAALLIESGAYQDVDTCVLVSSPLELRLQRIMQRDGQTHDAILQRIHAQWSDEKKLAYCQHQIHNDSSHALIPQVLALHRLFLSSTVE